MKMKLMTAAIACTLIPSMAQAADFNGPHLAVLIGWDDLSYEDDGLGFDDHITDVTYGIASGYDFEVSPKFIVGLGLSTTLSSNKKTVVSGIDEVTIKAKRDFEIGARAGAIVGDTVLIYAKAAYANAKFKASLTTRDITTSDSTTDGGYRLGAGLEAAIGGKLFGTLEYRFTGYGNGLTRNQVLGGVGIRF